MSPRLAFLALAGAGLAAFASVGRPTAPALHAAEPEPAPATPPASAQGGFGTIKGRLVWGGSDVPTPRVVIAKGATVNDKGESIKDPEVCSATNIVDRELIVDPATKGVRFGFAFLKNPVGKNPEAEKALVEKQPVVEIDQKNCEFLPYAVTIFSGQKVAFKSSDPVGHNLRYSGFTNAPKNVLLPPQGSMEEKLRAERLPFELKCDIHPWMSGWMLVQDHPFMAVTDDQGNFEITGVPAGEQTLVVWRKLYVNPEGGTGKKVKVAAGQTVDVGTITIDPAKFNK